MAGSAWTSATERRTQRGIPSIGNAANIFLSQFLHSPASLGSPLQSSPRMARAMLDRLPWDTIGTMVEYGPGTGVFTRRALGRMRPGSRLVAIDSEQRLVDYLNCTIRDRRLVALAGSALEATGRLAQHCGGPVDCILSGIPFSLLEPDAQREFVQQSLRLLKPGGLFLAYQARRAIEPYLRSAFASVHRQRFWLNLPPCHLYMATNGTLSRAER